MHRHGQFVHPSTHALSITTPSGVQVLLHIGLDTVTLRGVGFEPLVAAGDQVQVGDELIRFDLIAVAESAKSLLTQVVVTNGDRVAALRPATGLVTAGRDVVAVLELSDGRTGPQTPVSGLTAQSTPITIRNPSGLHARPVSVLTTQARQFTSSVHLVKDGTRSDAKSATSLMMLSVGYGNVVTVEANGPDASTAVAALAALIEEGLGEDISAPTATSDKAASAVTAPAAHEPAPVAADPSAPGNIAGVPASRGIAVGTLARLERTDIVVEEHAHPVPRRGGGGPARSARPRATGSTP